MRRGSCSKKEETSTAARGRSGETAARAEMKVAELSSARQALEGEEVALGTRDTLLKLKDETKRPSLPRDPLPPEILNYSPRVPFPLIPENF